MRHTLFDVHAGSTAAVAGISVSDRQRTGYTHSAECSQRVFYDPG